MYPASSWSVLAPGHHGQQRIIALISWTGLGGPNGSPGFDDAGKTVFSISLLQLANLGGEPSDLYNVDVSFPVVDGVT